LVLDEAERSIHDALCVVRCLVKKQALVCGGGAPETEITMQLSEYAKTLDGAEAYCFRECVSCLPPLLGLSGNPACTHCASVHWTTRLILLLLPLLNRYAEAFDVIPFTLAENAGLNPIGTVTQLRTRHNAGEKNAGINVRKG
jgi:T-complex protein 1 subunit delta